MANGSVVSFDIGILLWLAGLDMAQRNAIICRPLFERLADIFRAIINPDRKRPSAPCDDAVERADDPRGAQSVNICLITSRQPTHCVSPKLVALRAFVIAISSGRV